MLKPPSPTPVDAIPAAPCAFALGSAVAAASIGLVPILGETFGAGQGGARNMFFDGVFVLIVCTFQALLWGTAAWMALYLGRVFGLLLLGLFGIGCGVLKMAMVGFALQETPRPSLVPGTSSWIAAGCDLLLVLSFAGVLSATVRESRGEVLDLPAAVRAWGWLVLVALLGAAIAPYGSLRVLCMIVGAIGVVALLREVPAPRPPRALLRAILPGAASALTVIVGLGLASTRFDEHRRLTDPGLLGVYKLSSAQHCYVVPTREVEPIGISLFRINCGGGPSNLVGWDRAAQRAVEGPELEALRRR